MDRNLATDIADVLNKRGFVTHGDFSIGLDDKFANYLIEHENLLRECGYDGGPLKSWSTGFRLPLTYDYGVIDSEERPKDEWIDSYVLATSELLEESKLCGNDLRKMLLKLEFRCPKCDSITKIHPDTIPFKQRNWEIHKIPACCCTCHEALLPFSVSPIFNCYP